MGLFLYAKLGWKEGKLEEILW